MSTPLDNLNSFKDDIDNQIAANQTLIDRLSEEVARLQKVNSDLTESKRQFDIAIVVIGTSDKVGMAKQDAASVADQVSGNLKITPVF